MIYQLGTLCFNCLGKNHQAISEGDYSKQMTLVIITTEMKGILKVWSYLKFWKIIIGKEQYPSTNGLADCLEKWHHKALIEEDYFKTKQY